VELALDNAHKAGVAQRIRIRTRDIREFKTVTDTGIVVTNPPYGERLLDQKAARELYKIMGQQFRRRDGFSYGIITPDEEFEKNFGRRADKHRKLYNGMLKCQLFLYEDPAFHSKKK